MSILSGECNRCGLCCAVDIGDKRFVCQYLRATLGPTYQAKPLGTPGASLCGAYGNRYDGMPIQLRRMASDGSTEVIHAQCGKDSWAETKAILERGVGRGCSLEVNKAEVPPLTTYSFDDEAVDEFTWLRKHGYTNVAPPQLIATPNDTVFIRTGKA